jgi:SAM-dependent methyltransferase
LLFLAGATGIDQLVGVDVSEKSLALTRDRVGCDVHLGSIVDPGLATQIGRRFDFAVVAAVLHHLIGSTRAESRRYAQQAVHNALSLLNPGGHLVVFEPVWYPRLAMDALFYVKKLVSSITPKRVTIFDTWNNIGAPVVSYYSNEELLRMVTAGGRAEIVAKDIEPDDLGRLNLVLNKTNTTILARNISSSAPRT